MTKSSKTQGRWIYKVYLHDCYDEDPSFSSSANEDLNAVLAEGWKINKFSAVGAKDSVYAVLLLRRWQDGGNE